MRNAGSRFLNVQWLVAPARDDIDIVINAQPTMPVTAAFATDLDRQPVMNHKGGIGASLRFQHAPAGSVWSLADGLPTFTLPLSYPLAVSSPTTVLGLQLMALLAAVTSPKNSLTPSVGLRAWLQGRRPLDGFHSVAGALSPQTRVLRHAKVWHILE